MTDGGGGKIHVFYILFVKFFTIGRPGRAEKTAARWVSGFQRRKSGFQRWISLFQRWISHFQHCISYFQRWILLFQCWISHFQHCISYFQRWILLFHHCILLFQCCISRFQRCIRFSSTASSAMSMDLIEERIAAPQVSTLKGITSNHSYATAAQEC